MRVCDETPFDEFHQNLEICLLFWYRIDGISPLGGGARRWRGWNIPLPQYHASPIERFSLEHPPPPSAFRASARPLPRGRASVWRLARWPCPGTETGFRQGVHIKPWRCSSPAVHRVGIANLGWGSPVAGMEHPPSPSILHLRLNGFRWNTPTARPLIKASSRPLEGGGQFEAVVPVAVCGRVGAKTGSWRIPGETAKRRSHQAHE